MSLCRLTRLTSIAFLAILLVCSSQVWAQGTGSAFITPVGIAVAEDSSLFVVDERIDTIFKINPLTGDRTVLASQSVGLGIDLRQAVALTSNNNSELLVADRELDAILAIDVNTGNRRLISGCPSSPDPCAEPLIGIGPAFGDPVDLEVRADGLLLVLDVGDLRTALISVDVATGTRTVVSSSIVGTGPVFSLPVGVATDDRGDVFVLDQTLDAVVKVELGTGARTVVSGCAEAPDPCPVEVVGRGPDFSRPTSIAYQSLRNFVITDEGLGAIIRVNASTGTRTILSDSDNGEGPIFLNPVAIAVESTGTILVVDASRKAVIRVNPRTGDRTIVSKEIDLIVAPPTGIYSSTQGLDLALIVDRDGEISNFNVILGDNNDVTDQLMPCLTSAPLAGGGTIMSCQDINSVLNLAPGRHRLRFAFLLGGGPQGTISFIRKVTWDLLQ